jgi:hypothetical protein
MLPAGLLYSLLVHGGPASPEETDDPLYADRRNFG